MDQRARDVIDQSNYLFGKRGSLMSLWQEIADNFYPERGQFTVSHNLGDDFAGHLTTSYPLLARRDLGNSFSSMLRPSGQEWFRMSTSREEEENDREGKAWLEEMTKRQRRAMYDPEACFTRATKEGDHDFAAFGQCVITPDYLQSSATLLYRSWHIADVVWCEGINGRIDSVYRRWKPTIREMMRLFPGKLHGEMMRTGKEKPYTLANILHCCVPSDQYDMDKKARRLPFVSIYIDVDNQHVIEEVPQYAQKYIIPRWQTVSGSQYAHSPATVAALPDARLIQAMTAALLEAGEKAANPPMAGIKEAIRGDVDLSAGGFTALEADYDERLGEVLRPIATEWRGVPIGVDLADRVNAMIKEAFYLNKLTPMPMMGGPEMTAFEVGQRVQDWIRQAIPLFEPMEAEYNGALCNATFEILLRNGLFGPANEIPRSLSGQDIQFRFESPLTEAIERKKGSQFLEAKSLLAEAAALDPSAASMIDAKAALRDVLSGIRTPAKWMRDEKQIEEIAAQQQEASEGEQAMIAAQQGADVMATVAKAAPQAVSQAI